MTENNFSKKNTMLRSLLVDYYTKYYRDALGLPDYQSRVQRRLNEEDIFAKPNIDRLQQILHYEFSKNMRVLVLGAGTGAEFICFAKAGCDVYAVEPNEKAVEIIKLKCSAYAYDPSKVITGYAEQMPFDDDFFDFVYCFTVLEHVQDVEAAVKEAIRVTKKNGGLFFVTPDYRQLYEAHYKIHMPMFMPRLFIKILLMMKRRPVAFLDSLQLVTASQLRAIFRNNKAIAMHIFFPHEAPAKSLKGWSRAVHFVQTRFGIETNQFWLLYKT
jgi:SAM-dependent methyltransferase